MSSSRSHHTSTTKYCYILIMCRDEDKAILESTSKESEKNRFDDIAKQLQRTREEVCVCVCVCVCVRVCV